jgi:homoserine dehydrogenase
MAGFGQVARSFLELLPEKQDYLHQKYNLAIQVVAICDSTEYRLNPEGFDPEELLAHKLAKNSTSYRTDDTLSSDIPVIVESFIQTEVDVVVETLPPDYSSGEPGLSYLRGFLAHGIPVVTTNQSPLLLAYDELRKISRQRNVPVKFGATLAAVLPVTELATAGAAGTAVYGFEGIFSGIANLLLAEMIHNRSSLADEIEIATEMEVCPPNPAADIDGWTTAYDTLLLAKMLMNPNARLADVEVAGITGLTFDNVAQVVQEGNTLKLLGKASYRDDRLRLRVTPSIITPDHPFFRMNGAEKSVILFTEGLGKLIIRGAAPGTREMAHLVLRDIINLFHPAGLP